MHRPRQTLAKARARPWFLAEGLNHAQRGHGRTSHVGTPPRCLCRTARPIAWAQRCASENAAQTGGGRVNEAERSRAMT
eukprot:14643876-Alexandrium_andersonii.AAC.1